MCGNSSAGRASRCQRECREFESRFPLHILTVCIGLDNKAFFNLTSIGWVAKRLCRGLQSLIVEVIKNGEFLSEGKGSAVQGHPAQAVAWLANTLGEYDIPLLKGEIILSGSLVPLEPAKAGDKFSMELKGVGTCEINFI